MQIMAMANRIGLYWFEITHLDQRGYGFWLPRGWSCSTPHVVQWNYHYPRYVRWVFVGSTSSAWRWRWAWCRCHSKLAGESGGRSALTDAAVLQWEGGSQGRAVIPAAKQKSSWNHSSCPILSVWGGLLLIFSFFSFIGDWGLGIGVLGGGEGGLGQSSSCEMAARCRTQAGLARACDEIRMN